MTQPHLKDLASKYPPLKKNKLYDRLKHISDMLKYYDSQVKIAGGYKKGMFENYIAALLYAETIIKLHAELTELISKIAGDDDFET